MILLPSKNREYNLKRFIQACEDTQVVEKHVIILEYGDSSVNLTIPENWEMRCYSGGNGAASHFNKIFEEFPNEEYYAFLADDVIPRTKNWDIELKTNCLEYLYAWPEDGERGEKFASHAFISGRLVRAVGKLNPLDLDHFGFDNFWFHLAKDLGVGKFCKNVLVEHMHPRLGKATIDSTYKEQVLQVIPSKNPDSTRWRTFKNSVKWNGFVNGVKFNLIER